MSEETRCGGVPQPSTPPQYTPEPTPSWAMAGWALGLALAGLTPIGFGLAVAVLVRSRKDGRNHGKGLAIAALITSVLITVVAVAVAANYWFHGWDDTKRDDDGQVIRAGAVTTDRLRIGDCFNDQIVADAPPDSYDIDASGEVIAVPCDEPHQFETFHIVKIDEDTFPGDDAIQGHAAECLVAWDDYIGTPYRIDHRYELSYYYPSSTSWRFGDRQVVCNVYARDGSLITGSIRNDP